MSSKSCSFMEVPNFYSENLSSTHKNVNSRCNELAEVQSLLHYRHHITDRESSYKNYLVKFASFLGVSKRKRVDGLKESTDLQQRDSRRSLSNKEEGA